MNTPINELQEGKTIEGKYVIKYKKPPIDYKSGKEGSWFELRLADKSGEITAKYWGRDKQKTKQIFDSMRKDDIIQLRATVREFNNNYELSIDDIKVLKEGEYSLDEFLSKTPKDIGQMAIEMESYLSLVKDPYLKILLDSFFKDKEFMDKFKYCPAAMHNHQNYIGGLLEHTLNVVKICDFIQKVHTKMDLDLLIAGAALHDIGKMKEFEVTHTIDISREGMLVGHLILGKEMVSEKIRLIPNFPENLKLKIIHIVLSHHGKKEHGSPKEPQFPEAMAIHAADTLDAKVDHATRLKEEARTDDPWIWTKDFGHIYLE